MNDTDRSILLQLFVDGLPDCGIALLDVDGRVVSWNSGAQAILGYGPGEIVGRHFACLYTKQDIALAQPELSLGDAKARGRQEEIAGRLHKDGTRVETQSVLMALHDPQHKLIGFGNLMREVASSAQGVAANTYPQATDLASPNKHEKILLVEDDDSVREVASQQLSSLGYRVISASNGTDALELLARTADVDLLFTDVVMPGGMNGGQVAEAARRVRPGLKVLFASGYFEGALVREGNIEASAQFLVKPYRKKELAQKVEEVLSIKAPAL
jgi:PAS domain S-box-containing protein